jgi:hypothetical protein
LARIASGEYLWVFNDDLLLLESNWDILLLKHLDRNCIHFFHNQYQFPIYGKNVYAVTLNISRYCYVDDWALEVSKRADVTKIIPACNLDHSSVRISLNHSNPMPAMSSNASVMSQLDNDAQLIKQYMRGVGK